MAGPSGIFQVLALLACSVLVSSQSNLHSTTLGRNSTRIFVPPTNATTIKSSSSSHLSTSASISIITSLTASNSSAISSTRSPSSSPLSTGTGQTNITSSSSRISSSASSSASGTGASSTQSSGASSSSIAPSTSRNSTSTPSNTSSGSSSSGSSSSGASGSQSSTAASSSAQSSSGSTSSSQSRPTSNTPPITGTSTSSSSTSTPTVPFGVYVTTVSNKPYTLTYISTTASRDTTVIESNSQTTTTGSITAGGAIWAVPTLPPGFPPGPPGPPPGAPKPTSGGGSNPGCLFGCGGGGGGGLPCVINCGGGGGGSPTGGNNPTSGNPTSGNPTSNDPTSNPTSQSTSEKSSSSSSAECTKGSAVPSCKETVVLSTSFASGTSSSTVITTTATSCTTITTCSGGPTTQRTTTATGSATEYVCAPTGGCGSGTCGLKARQNVDAKARRAQPKNLPRKALPKLISGPGLTKRGLPAPDGEDSSSLDKFISGIFGSNNVRGSGSGDALVSVDGGDPFPTSRYDEFGDESFSAGMNGLFGCTAIVVASRAGVWTGHFWESVGFKGTTPSNAASWGQFEKYVLNALSGDELIDGFSPLTKVPSGAFDQNKDVQVLISTPAKPGSGDPKNAPAKYPDQVSAIQKKLTEIISGLKSTDITTWNYAALQSGQQERDDALKNSARGKVLTNYDHNADDKGNPGYQTWAESSVALQDTWSTGGESCSRNQKRQSGGSCSPSGSATPSATGGSTSVPSSSGFSTVTTASSSVRTTSVLASSTSSKPSSTQAPALKPSCDEGIAIKSEDAESIQKEWAGKSGEACVPDGLQATVIGLGPNGGQVMLNGDSKACVKYSDMAASLEAMIKSCTNGGSMTGQNSVNGGKPNINIETYNTLLRRRGGKRQSR